MRRAFASMRGRAAAMRGDGASARRSVACPWGCVRAFLRLIGVEAVLG